jgi:hypothetical protein
MTRCLVRLQRLAYMSPPPMGGPERKEELFLQFSGRSAFMCVYIQKKKPVVMGVADSSLKQSSQHLSFCNPKSTLSQSKTVTTSNRVHFLQNSNPNQNDEPGQRRRSIDSSPRESGNAEKQWTGGIMRQPQIEECFGGLGVNCCGCNNPATSKVSGGQANSGRMSSRIPSQTVLTRQRTMEIELRDKTLAALNGKEAQARNISSWERDPSPMEGWSEEEQQSLIHELSKSPRGLRKCQAHRELVFSKLVRQRMPLEGRKVLECEECYRHIEANRIVFFGPIQHQRATHHHTASASAHNTR